MTFATDSLPEEIYQASQVRELDQLAIQDMGITGYELMCRAGEAACDVLRLRWPSTRAIQIFCGAGNNAGDGYVVARLALKQGYEVVVSAVVAPEKLSGDAERAYADYRDSGGKVETLKVATSAFSADLIIDALLGVGFGRELEGLFKSAVEVINEAQCPVLALDVPTGLHADTGSVISGADTKGLAVRADATITFVALKQGLFLGEAMDYRGELFFSDLGIQWNRSPSQRPSLRRLDQSFLAKTLQPRKQTAHKGSHGRLLLVGGGVGMSGAIRLAAEAALRAGAGLVQVATHPANVEQVMEGRAEIMCLGITNPDDLNVLANQADAVVLGPGLGGDSWAKGVWQQIMDSNWQRMVLDADGLNFLAQEVPWVGGAKQDNWILTPHPGEAARLLSPLKDKEISTAHIQAERLKHANDLAEYYDGIVVLKGAGSLVAAPHGAITSVCDFGNPGMATAGMGDVLSGIIGALCVQGNAAVDAACAGVLLHALAGDDAAAQGQRGTLAGDLMPYIRKWANTTSP